MVQNCNDEAKTSQKLIVTNLREFFSAPSSDRSSVNHDGGSVKTTHGNQTAGHVLVASGDSNEAIIPLQLQLSDHEWWYCVTLREKKRLALKLAQSCRRKVKYLSTHDCLDTVGNHISWLKGETHAIGAHWDTITYSDSVESESSETGFTHTCLDYCFNGPESQKQKLLSGTKKNFSIKRSR